MESELKMESELIKCLKAHLDGRIMDVFIGGNQEEWKFKFDKYTGIPKKLIRKIYIDSLKGKLHYTYCIPELKQYNGKEKGLFFYRSTGKKGYLKRIRLNFFQGSLEGDIRSNACRYEYEDEWDLDTMFR